MLINVMRCDAMRVFLTLKNSCLLKQVCPEAQRHLRFTIIKIDFITTNDQGASYIPSESPGIPLVADCCRLRTLACWNGKEAATLNQS